MKRILLALALMILAGGVFSKTTEYKYIVSWDNPMTVEELNAMGKKGWNLVSVFEDVTAKPEDWDAYEKEMVRIMKLMEQEEKERERCREEHKNEPLYLGCLLMGGWIYPNLKQSKRYTHLFKRLK